MLCIAADQVGAYQLTMNVTIGIPSGPACTGPFSYQEENVSYTWK